MELFVLALALPFEMAGLFAIWNWARRFRAFGWVVLGAALLMCLAGFLAMLAPDPAEPRLYLALFATYLLSGLIWAWWVEGLKPRNWQPGEFFIALAAAVLFSLASLAL